MTNDRQVHCAVSIERGTVYTGTFDDVRKISRSNWYINECNKGRCYLVVGSRIKITEEFFIGALGHPDETEGK